MEPEALRRQLNDEEEPEVIDHDEVVSEEEDVEKHEEHETDTEEEVEEQAGEQDARLAPQLPSSSDPRLDYVARGQTRWNIVLWLPQPTNVAEEK